MMRRRALAAIAGGLLLIDHGHVTDFVRLRVIAAVISVQVIQSRWEKP
ncbi:MAG: hypothetical protein FWG99_06185 [Treponema sp.]|nr:hypothetical protein [Treponema sp.]